MSSVVDNVSDMSLSYVGQRASDQFRFVLQN